MAKIYLFFGPQGSGKSTQAEKLSVYLGVPYFNTGDQLRALSQSNTPQGVAVAESMKKGELVDDGTMRSLFSSFVENNDVSRGFVADGFPRKSSQLELLESLAQEYGWEVSGIFIDIKDETVEERLSHRLIIMNGEQVRREDDQPDILKKRLAAYRHDTVPIINWLKSQGELVMIDGEPGIDVVFNEVIQAINGQH